MDLSSVLIEEEMSSPSDEIPAVEYIVRAKGMPFGSNDDFTLNILICPQTTKGE